MFINHNHKTILDHICISDITWMRDVNREYHCGTSTLALLILQKGGWERMDIFVYYRGIYNLGRHKKIEEKVLYEFFSNRWM